MKLQKVISIVFLFLSYIVFASCQGNSEKQDYEDQQKPASTQKLQKDKNDLSQLDILKDYDRDLWTGPDGWTDEQWRWKKLLKWDRNCDYVADVETHDINEQFQLVTVQCVPGTYQPMYYLFLFDRTTQKSKQLNLGLPDSTDNPKEVFGTIGYDNAKQQMSILSLSRGVGDCGSFRLFNFIVSKNLNEAGFLQKELRVQPCKDYAIDNVDNLPKSMFDYRNWPLVK
jgi:hypothetical protein